MTEPEPVTWPAILVELHRYLSGGPWWVYAGAFAAPWAAFGVVWIVNR